MVREFNFESGKIDTLKKGQRKFEIIYHGRFNTIEGWKNHLGSL